jgi:hypothetical protein
MAVMGAMPQEGVMRTVQEAGMLLLLL